MLFVKNLMSIHRPKWMQLIFLQVSSGHVWMDKTVQWQYMKKVNCWFSVWQKPKDIFSQTVSTLWIGQNKDSTFKAKQLIKPWLNQPAWSKTRSQKALYNSYHEQPARHDTWMCSYFISAQSKHVNFCDTIFDEVNKYLCSIVKNVIIYIGAMWLYHWDTITSVLAFSS